MSPCPYCSVPMTGRKVNHCGAVECQRMWQRNRMCLYMRGRRLANGRDRYPARECAACGKTFQPPGRDATMCCSRVCTNVMRYGDGPRWKPLRRPSISPAKRLGIYERDDWTCYLCGYAVDRTAIVPDLEAPTLDHMVPVASGGGDEVENLKTAHFYCNSFKRNLPFEMVA